MYAGRSRQRVGTIITPMRSGRKFSGNGLPGRSHPQTKLRHGSAQPLTITLTYTYAPKGRSGEALGLRIMANKVTQIGVPLLFGGMGAALGAAPVFLATGGFLLAAGMLSLRATKD